MSDGIFYNTTNEQGQTLGKYRESAKAQDKIVLKVFVDNPDQHFTAYDVQQYINEYFEILYPRTSVGRSMNTLTREGLIKKTTVKAIREYGRPCYTWVLNKPEKEKPVMSEQYKMFDTSKFVDHHRFR